jgi:hypothetical protein
VANGAATACSSAITVMPSRGRMPDGERYAALILYFVSMLSQRLKQDLLQHSRNNRVYD